MSETLISTFKSGQLSIVAGETDLYEYLDKVRFGRWQDAVLSVRSEKDEDNRKAKKRLMPSVTISGTFEKDRKKVNFKKHSGIIGIDLDEADNPALQNLRKDLEADPYCHACHHSVGGFGLVWYVKVDPERHYDAFQAIEIYLVNKYNVVVDPSGKDVTRLRYVSYDPSMFIKRRSKTWKSYIKAKERRQRAEANKMAVYHEDDISYIMEQIIQTGNNIAEDYNSWLHVGFALAYEFGEGGRHYYHIVSSQSSKYNTNQCDKQFDICLKREAGGVTMGTFFYLCQQAGIETMTGATRQTISIYQQRVKMGRDRKEAGKSTLEFMQKMHNLDKERVLPVLDQLKEVTDKELKEKKVNDQLKELENFLLQQKLRKNEMTQLIELDGKPIRECDVNEIWRQALHAVDKNLKRYKLWDLIDSGLIDSYHPFVEFFEKYKNLRPTGILQEVLDCFEYDKPEGFPEDKDFLEYFLRRWLLSIISAMHGTYSLLTLVLGGEQGTGKTKFFRGLLPEELKKKYYTENKLDGGKDTDMLMCVFLIIMDDEFGGKSKVEAKRFKELSSRETFFIRKPYGRTFEEMNRLSVLCGTTNDTEVLNDATGNRRLIPVNVTKFDHERYQKIDKVELFMELYWMWKEVGDNWMLDKEAIELLNKSTVKNQKPITEQELLQHYFELPDRPGHPNASYLTNTEILVLLQGMVPGAIKLNPTSLGLVLGKLGYKKQRKRIRGISKTVYEVICNIERNIEVRPPGLP